MEAARKDQNNVSKARPHRNAGGSNLIAKAIDPSNGTASDDRTKDSFHLGPNWARMLPQVVIGTGRSVMELNSLMVRYIVNDVDAAIAFYTQRLKFSVTAQSGPYFALLARENLQLVLSPPKGPGGGSQPMPDGSRPEPGGWNRIIVRSSNLERDAEALKKAGVRFHNDIVAGPGGRQILIEDPSGNLVELSPHLRGSVGNAKASRAALTSW